ncbi:MAG: 3-deoxy-manno-octulosonate cytidylyltransferase [bacterium]
MEIIGVIPARYNSTRLPGKPLIRIQGKPLIQWTYENALKSNMLSRIIVATDDRRIFRVVQMFGGQSILTSSRCRTGTDRIAEVASKIKGDIFVNIQGDEPLIHYSIINRIVRELIKNKSLQMVTAAVPITELRQLKDQNNVKVVLNRKGLAHYFSRSIIPFPRDCTDLTRALKRKYFLKHCGIYAYRRDFVCKFRRLSKSFNEHIEKLEQLRVLDYGYNIKVLRTQFDSLGVDTKHDVKKINRMLKPKTKEG